jgi:uncharacterized membrane protein YdjX (TVP38/TMEM64 family)
MNTNEKQYTALRFAALGVVVLLVVVVPWVLWGSVVDSWVHGWLNHSTVTPLLALIIVLLLAADVLLPIPSSLVAVAAGVFLGFALGSLVVFVGLTLGCVIGYFVGASWGAVVARAVVGERSWQRAEQLAQRYGSGIVLALRPVPVLAEASTFFAGATHMPWGLFLLNVSLANAAVAVAYAGVGELSADTGHLELGLIAGCLLPGLAILIAGFVRRRM